MKVHKVVLPPDVTLKMCEDCLNKQDNYKILKKDVDGDCQHITCENRGK